MSAEPVECWICLGGDAPLVRPCACAGHVHPACMARWQLQKAGGAEESICRFCERALPDWRPALTPADVSLEGPVVMAVNLYGREHRIGVRFGPDGRQEFERTVRELYRLEDAELDFTFECTVPGSDDAIVLEGKDAFAAAWHCARVKAAMRERDATASSIRARPETTSQ